MCCYLKRIRVLLHRVCVNCLTMHSRWSHMQVFVLQLEHHNSLPRHRKSCRLRRRMLLRPNPSTRGSCRMMHLHLLPSLAFGRLLRPTKVSFRRPWEVVSVHHSHHPGCESLHQSRHQCAYHQAAGLERQESYGSPLTCPSFDCGCVSSELWNEKWKQHTQ